MSRRRRRAAPRPVPHDKRRVMVMKKFINKPENLVAELLEGYALACGDKIGCKRGGLP